MYVEIEAFSDVICDSSQLGDCCMLFPESKLGMRKQMMLIDKGCQSDCYYTLESFSECAKKTDWSVGVRIGAGFGDRNKFCCLPGRAEVAQP
jgi:hypothetical protein